MRARPGGFVAMLLTALAFAACDRAIEPFDPSEKPATPDLAKIFPPGAEKSREDPSGARGAMPPPPPGMPPGGAASAGPPAGAGESGGAPILGTVQVAPELAGRANAAGVLFVVARGPSGGPPVAVKRIESPRFPLEFQIGPDDRMIQAVPFAGPLVLSARLDADGNATTREAGDLQGNARAAAAPGDTGVTILLDQVL